MQRLIQTHRGCYPHFTSFRGDSDETMDSYVFAIDKITGRRFVCYSQSGIICRVRSQSHS